MHADFSRDTFDPAQHNTRVLFQQGRVTLDADLNEMTAIANHALRTLVAGLIGPWGGLTLQASKPDDTGFSITWAKDENGQNVLQIGAGRYYVGGMLCQNEQPISYINQPGVAEKELKPPFVAYLDVWERHVTALDEPGLREVGLGLCGPDTATRARVVWQVRLTNQRPVDDKSPGQWNGKAFQQQDDIRQAWYDWFEKRQQKAAEVHPELCARGKAGQKEQTEPCVVPADAGYRGVENQLYRVEVHQVDETGRHASFKWSRENGAVTFAIDNLAGRTVTIKPDWRQAADFLKPGDIVEIIGEAEALEGKSGSLIPIESLEGNTVRLKDAIGNTGGQPRLLRRWDHGGAGLARGGWRLDRQYALALDEPDSGQPNDSDKHWLNLEQGIQVAFNQKEKVQYQVGDYWLIPARTATGDIDWPYPEPAWRRAQRVEHYYAPLAFMKDATSVKDLRTRYCLTRL